MYKDYRYINAGTFEFYRWGGKARERAAASLTPNDQGFYSIECDGGNYWTIGTSEGKYGEYAKYKDTYFSVKECGYYSSRIYVHKDSPKLAAFIEMVKDMIKAMEEKMNSNRRKEVEEEDE